MNFFKKQFNGNEFMIRCQCALRRISAQQKKYQTHSKTFKKQIIELLQNNERDKAFDKCTLLVQEDYKNEALTELIDTIDELMKNSEIIGTQRICPLELKSACGAILYASPYFPDHTEMMEMRNMLIDKFGKTFPEECVNSKVISPKLLSRLSSKPVDSDVVNYYLDNIAKENNLATEESKLPEENPNEMLPADASKCELSRLLDGKQNNKYTFGVLTKNIIGKIKKGGDKVEAYISGPNNTKIIGEVTDLHDGTYDIVFTPPYAGNYLIAVYVNDKQVEQIGKLHILEASSLDLNKCIIEGNGIKGGYVNEKQSFTIFAKDSYGQTINHGGEPFAAYIAGPNDVKIIGDITDLGNGQYDVSYVPPIKGNYAIAVYHNTTLVQSVFNFSIQERNVQQQFPTVQQYIQPQIKNSFIPVQGKPGEHFIIDIGSCSIKSGFESVGNPSILTPTVVGKNLHQTSGFVEQDLYVGDEAIDKRGILSLEYPMQKEPIDYNSLRSIMKHSVEVAQGHPTVVVTNGLTPLQMKINISEMLFNEGIQSIRFVDEAQAISRLYNKQSCIIVNIGGMMSWVIPVINGIVYKDISQKLPIAGVKCTETLMTLLSKEGIILGSTSSEKEIARQIKEAIGYIQVDPNSSIPSVNYSLPDGTSLTIGNSRVQCFEPMFNPQLCAMNCNGISQMIATVLRSINGCTNEIIFVGGGSLIKGLKERIETDIQQLLNFKINVIAEDNRKFASWLGANLLDKENIGKVITLDTWKQEGALCLDD
ncbi:actin, putative [Entamoeba dispar SAW760]|uniref:Actin, putative n=1 Tax=Entamoeba dispar (strain ATCC PRA-260 / SAW760) TaxID=370354 RepID=B0E8M3_ENTDS|nr:actin, putative [Entamoeba dispar SAW760]EDR29113.1 actin, putative [Entamoeba dispar SAW760]|eukprot:EDR29113.1 actin, putative [Entamoeba dispar SAW760]